ncbi:hypothetical protein ACHAWF_008056, partial [Thalassiosira exigua]
SVKFRGGCIASTSDDRTVRLWALTPRDSSPRGEERGDDRAEKEGELRAALRTSRDRPTSARRILDSASSHAYELAWTGWGHAARVWDVSFASSRSADGPSLLASAGEDGVVRIWDPTASKEEVGRPLRGTRGGSVRAVDASDGVVAVGGDDGCVRIYDLASRVGRGVGEAATTTSEASFVVPSDGRVEGEAGRPEGIDAGPSEGGAGAEIHDDDALDTVEASRTKKGKKGKKKPRKKSTSDGRAICGMEFYGDGAGRVPTKLLVVTRAGGMSSLSLIDDEWTVHDRWSDRVVSASSDRATPIRVDPSTGYCVGIRPRGDRAVVGTTSGTLVATSLATTSVAGENEENNVAFGVSSHGAVRSLSFVNCDGLLALHARGTVVWFAFGAFPTPLHVVAPGTGGIPLSVVSSRDGSDLFVGDTRGNVAHFDLRRSSEASSDEADARAPRSVLARAHGREHVAALAVQTSTGVVVSVGNDGCVVTSGRDEAGRLRKMLSVPVQGVTGLTNVLSVDRREGLIVGGFYGNDFVVLDVANGYEFLRVATGGRQRRRDFFFGFRDGDASRRCPYLYGMAILVDQKGGRNVVDVRRSHLLDEETSQATIRTRGDAGASYSVGSSFHAEAVNDACWVRCRGSAYLLTGSNDCTVKLSKLVEDDELVTVTDLSPHESCVRGVCSSSHETSDSSLLVTCGGKLGMEFYVLCPSSQADLADDYGRADCCVSFLCSYRTLGKKATIDHRMNAVRAALLHPAEAECHLVLAGDSDGNLHLCVVSERSTATGRSTIVGSILACDARPVLCLELIRSSDSIVAFVGTTGGDVHVWRFPGRVAEDAPVHCLEGSIPQSPSHVIRAHQTGVNALTATYHKSSAVIVCSVGDDQSLAISTILNDESCQPNERIQMKECRPSITTRASASAIKAVKIIPGIEEFTYRVYTPGQLWHLGVSAQHCFQLSLISPRALVSGPCDNSNSNVQRLPDLSSLGTEGECIDIVHIDEPDGSVKEVIAVGGEGVQLKSLNLNTLRAACALRKANYLLVTAGAGFSADSGLQTYEAAPAEYKEMCNPSELTRNPHHFQQFWFQFTKSYIETKPHNGYDIIDEWCSGGRLFNLKWQRADTSTPWWVYSSNVDGHFRMFKSFRSSVCEIHGSALEFKCACGIGYSGPGKPRIGDMWEKWNKKVLATNQCKLSTVLMKPHGIKKWTESDEVFRCNHCFQPMRPNVLMFHDTDENVLKSIEIQRDRYQTWESLVEDLVVRNGEALVILEMGCGVNVPAVREESEEVFVDCSRKIEARGANTESSVCLIRINPKDAATTVDGGPSSEIIPIASKAATALYRIDCWINALGRSC